METNDIMSIQLDNILTKVLITAPTTNPNKIASSKFDTKLKTAGHYDRAPPSPTMTDCSETTASSMSAGSVDKYAVSTPSEKTSQAVVVSSETRVPDGQWIMEAKPVVALHAFFANTDKTLKDAMVSATMKQITQETMKCGCNSILGMSVSVKQQREIQGFMVKASGTPCLLMPTQLLLSSTKTSSTDDDSKRAEKMLQPRKQDAPDSKGTEKPLQLRKRDAPGRTLHQ